MERISSWFDEGDRSLLVEREGTFLAANLGSAACDIELASDAEIPLELTSSDQIRLNGRKLAMPARSVAVASTAHRAGGDVAEHHGRTAARVKLAPSIRESRCVPSRS
jgi:hypothetical protein